MLYLIKMKKNTVFLITFLVGFNLFSQKINFDKYQHIIVAEKFDFLKETDQYQTSSLTKFLLKKKGFKVFLSNENLPEELVTNRCSSLFASVRDESSMINVKSVIEIKDCYGKVLYASKIGLSRLKDFKKAHLDAIRNAYNTMEDFVYSYNTKSQNIEIEKPEVVIPLKVMDSVKVAPIINKVVTSGKDNVSKKAEVLYAQPKNNGYQLVNLKPEVVFVILNTNLKDVFIIKDKNGILYKNGNNCVVEFYENNQLIKKIYQVKF